jgi:hypothetical protein
LHKKAVPRWMLTFHTAKFAGCVLI